MQKTSIIKAVLVLAVIVALVVIIAVSLSGNNTPEWTVDQLMQRVYDGEVDAIRIEGSHQLLVRLVGSDNYQTALPRRPDAVVVISSRTTFHERWMWLDGQIRDREERRIEAEYQAEREANTDPNVVIVRPSVPINVLPREAYNDPTSGSFWVSMIFPIGGFLLVGFAIMFLMRQMKGSGNSAMNFGKTKARLNTNVKERFSDVAGAEEEKVELAEIVDFLKSPRKFRAVGARIPKGVLLVGPPGTGKTLFARAVAGEASVPFFSISGSDFVEMFVGTGAARVRDLFDQAKRNMPCIIFIDEIDAVGRQRGAGMGGGNDEREQTLNQLLVQMDGFEAHDGIIIMAATNRADILDPALMRPGRFDRQVYVHPPDVRGREDILKVHARNKPLAANISFKTLARMTSGFTGADLENLLNEAAILAARADRDKILMEDVLEGINKVIAGPQKKSRVVTDKDKRITAYHEAGHAILMKLLPGCDAVQEVSIIPRGMAAGYTLTRPETDDKFMTKKKLLDQIVGLLGGRAAEEIVIQDISTGASNDIERAGTIARKMVTEWGMSERLGNMFLGGGQEVFLGRDYTSQKGYSESIGAIVDDEIRIILEEAYKKAVSMLQQHRGVMDNMVKVLFENETIYSEEVDMLMNGVSAEDVIAKIASMKKTERAASNMPKARVIDVEVSAEPSAEETATEPMEPTELPLDDDLG